MLNLSALFFSGTETRAFLDELDLSPAERASITEAKTSVRESLRASLNRTLVENGYGETRVTPRFFTQGSWAYKTINAPAQQPQQADVDDGTYLPLSFVAETGTPREASSVFFAATEAVLGRLAREKGWHLVTDKATCVRLVVSSSAHIDVPLYAIPDNEFIKLAEAAKARGRLDARGAIIGVDGDDDIWAKLPKDHVLLAHRDEGWKKSDPRPIEDWFRDEVARHGEQYRRVVRYLKAHRDWQWVSGGPASILLMVASAPLFEAHDRRDDLALLHVVRGLPAALRDGVANPTDRSESLTKRLGPEGVEESARKLEQLDLALTRASNEVMPERANDILVAQFGPRFPRDPARVRTVSASATVAASPARVVSSPLVGRTRSG